jgi:hypothetical protein
MKIVYAMSRIKSDLAAGENIDAYVGVALGVTFTVLGIIGQVGQSWLSNFVLLTLTFMVVISLKNRYAIQRAERIFQASTHPDASDVLKDRTEYDPLDQRLLGAQEVIVIGRHLLGFVGFNRETIRKYAKQGCCWQFVMMDPSLAVPGESVARDIERSIQTLQRIEREYPGTVSVRTTRREVPCAVFAVDTDKSHGLIQIQPHPLFEESDLREHYDLRGSTGSRWYSYYREQIQLLWAESAPRVL